MLKNHSENLSELIKLLCSSSYCKRLVEDLETEGKGEVSHLKIAKIPANLPLQLVNVQQGSQELLASSPCLPVDLLPSQR